MKVLITGATGLIGKEVGKLLVAHGHEVVSLSRDTERARAQLPFESAIVSNEAMKSEAHCLEIQGIDAVVNLMGENLADHRWTDSFKKKLVESRVDQTRILKTFLEKQNALPKIWIQGSAIGFYGESKTPNPFHEESPKGKGFLPDLCEAWEHECETLPASVRRVFLRTGVVLSEKGGAFEQIVTPLLQGLAGVVGSGEQRMSLIHLTDMARFIVFALETSTVKGIYNLVCGEAVTQKDLTERLCKAFHLKQGPSVPAIAIKLLLGEMSELVLKSQAVVSTRLPGLSFKLEFNSADAIIAEVSKWYRHPFKADQSVFMVHAEQFIPTPKESIFPFFSEAKNLAKLTPDFLDFKIESVSTPEMKEGTEIRYQLKLHGVPFEWLTLISKWNPPVHFADQQLKGPYTLWYHEHEFKDVKAGTLMMDWVRYELPLGAAGKLLAFNKVKSEVAKIFSFRRQAIFELFVKGK